MQVKRKNKKWLILLFLPFLLLGFLFSVNNVKAEEDGESNISYPLGQITILPGASILDENTLIFCAILPRGEWVHHCEVSVSDSSICSDFGFTRSQATGNEDDGNFYSSTLSSFPYDYAIIDENFCSTFFYVRLLDLDTEFTVSFSFYSGGTNEIFMTGTSDLISYNSVENLLCDNPMCSLKDDRIAFLENQVDELIQELEELERNYGEFQGTFDLAIQYRNKIAMLEAELAKLQAQQDSKSQSTDGCAANIGATFIPAAVAVLGAGAVIGGKRYGKKTK